MNRGSSQHYLADALENALDDLPSVQSRGRVLEALGTVVRASGVPARVGQVCELVNPGDGWRLKAQVIGIAQDSVLLTPFGDLDGLSAHTEVINLGRAATVLAGPALLGRVLNGFGEPIDGRGAVEGGVQAPVFAPAPPPLSRRAIAQPLATGVRAIDGLLACGVGQRLGIFAPAGAGKSALLAMIARGTAADTTVVALVGERGREVGEFIEHAVSPERRGRMVFVVATSDASAGERAQAASVATAIAESFRAQGQSVLLLVDSVTRYARALREIGLAAGEPPTRRGYTPSVFSALPRLVERCGQDERGAITAFYTVLVDDDPTGDPIGEEMRALLDGHVMLSPTLAEAGHFPAIDVLASRSRVMRQVTLPRARELADSARTLLAKAQAVDVLLKIGEYKKGSDALTDRAIACRDKLAAFLRQDLSETSAPAETLRMLEKAVVA
jgi:ATP synthase in type III secretion protein N